MAKLKAKKPKKVLKKQTDGQKEQKVNLIVKLNELHTELTGQVPGGGTVDERQATVDKLGVIIADLQPLK